MQLTRLFLAVLATLASNAVACVGTAPADDDPAGSASEQIETGVAGAAAYPEVALLDGEKDGSPAPGCSGALIAPRAVLTSARCATRFDRWRVTFPFAAGQAAQGVGFAVYDFGRAAGSQRDVDQSVDSFHGGHAVDRSVDSWRGTDSVDQGPDTWLGDAHDVGVVFLDRPVLLRSYPEIAAAPVSNGGLVVAVARLHDGWLTSPGAYLSPPSTAEDASREGFPYDYAVPGADASGAGGPVVLPGTHTIVGVGAGSSEGTPLVARVDLLKAWIQDRIVAGGAS